MFLFQESGFEKRLQATLLIAGCSTTSMENRCILCARLQTGHGTGLDRNSEEMVYDLCMSSVHEVFQWGVNEGEAAFFKAWTSRGSLEPVRRRLAQIISLTPCYGTWAHAYMVTKLQHTLVVRLLQYLHLERTKCYPREDPIQTLLPHQKLKELTRIPFW